MHDRDTTKRMFTHMINMMEQHDTMTISCGDPLMELLKDVRELLKEQEAVVRCKDCKHRPKKPDWETFEDGGDIEFPDGKCPCQCSSDRYYSWYPEDNWFCADGERRTDDG